MWPGDSFTYVIANSVLGKVTDGGGTANLNGSSVAGYTGIVEFRKADGTRNGYIGFNAEAGAMNYGSDIGAGHYFAGGSISPDPAMKFGLRFNSVDGIVDFDSGDYLYYSRSADLFSFNIGNANKAQIDSGGNFSNAGVIFPGGDANYLLGVFSNIPRVQFDSNDNIAYDRAANAYSFNVGGAAATTIDGTGIATPNKVFPGADPNFYAGVVSSQPRILWDVSDSLQYDRTGNALTTYIGGSAQFTINPAGTFVANVLTVGDGNFGMSLNGGAQPLVLYDSGDYASFVRASNIFSWVIGNATKATLDSSGNLVAYGALIASAEFQLRAFDSGGEYPARHVRHRGRLCRVRPDRQQILLRDRRRERGVDRRIRQHADQGHADRE